MCLKKASLTRWLRSEGYGKVLIDREIKKTIPNSGELLSKDRGGREHAIYICEDVTESLCGCSTEQTGRSCLRTDPVLCQNGY